MTPSRRLRAPRTTIAALVLLSALAAASCISRAAIQTDPVVIAQRATQTLKVLDLVVESVAAAQTAGWISQPVARTIMLTIQRAIPSITTTPDGAKATAVQALKSAGETVGINPQVAAYLKWGSEAIGALP